MVDDPKPSAIVPSEILPPERKRSGYLGVLRTELTTVTSKWKAYSEAGVNLSAYLATVWLWLSGAANWQVMTVGGLSAFLTAAFLYQAGESAWRKEHATRLKAEGERDNLALSLKRALLTASDGAEAATQLSAKVSELQSELRVRAKQVGRQDWLKLAEDFTRIPGFEVRIDTTQWQDEPEQLLLRGGPDDQRACTPFFRLAGTMLLKSPKVYAALSGEIVAERDPVMRWLMFVKEKSGGVQNHMHGWTEDASKSEGQHRHWFGGTLNDIKAKSHQACIDCAASEI